MIVFGLYMTKKTSKEELFDAKCTSRVAEVNVKE